MDLPEKEAEKSANRFRDTVSQAPVGITILRGQDLIVEMANATYLELVDRDEKSFVGRPLLESLPEVRSTVEPLLLKVLATGEPFYANEFEVTLKRSGKKEQAFFNFIYQALREDDGVISGIIVVANEVTDTVRGKQLLAHSEQQIKDAAERLILATEGTQLSTWDLNLQTREIVHSPRLSVIFGFDENHKFTHQGMRDIIHPDDVKTIVEKAFDKALKTSIYFYEARVIHRDQSIHWIRTTGKVIYGEDRTPLRMVGTLMDITQEKLYQQRLDEDQERLNIVLEASELGIWELNIKTDQVITSPRYLEIFGYHPNDKIPHTKYLNQLHPDFISMRNEAFQNALRTGNMQYESAIIWDDKSIHWIEVKGKLIHDLFGEPEKLIGTLRDITNEKNYSQRIEESEKRFRSVADTAPVLIWMSTSDKLCNFFNKAWLNFTGRTMAEEIGNGWASGVHPEDLQRCYDHYILNFDQRKEFYMEYRLRRHDGEYRWINDNGVPRFTHDGAFEGYIGACMDIHERIAFEENLKESESRLRIAALSSELGTWSFNPKSGDLVWDSQSKALLDMAPDDSITGELFWTRVHPEDRDMAQQGMLRALDPLIAETYDLEYRIIFPGSDKIRWIHAKGKAFFDKQNEPYLFSGTILDITDKRLALEDVLESEEKFRLLANSMPQFIWTGDEKGVLNYFNEAVYNYSGLSREKIEKEGWLQIVHPDEQEQNIAQWVTAVATGNDFIFEHRFRRYDGEYRWQLSRAIAQRNANGKIQMWVGTSTDIHDRKVFTDDLETKVQQRTQELKITNDELKKTNSELEQFAYVASHDLQEPLRKIQTFATRVLEVENERLSPKGQDYLSRMQAASKRMQQLILDLLAFSRASTGDKHFEVVDMNLLLEKVKDPLSELIEKNKVTIKSEILPDLTVIAFQFEQLMTNLIGNAIKFARKDIPSKIIITSGSVPGNTIPHRDADPEKTYSFISVSDNGIGFDPQFAERIFQVFQRLHGKDSYEGTGIGLAICKKIVENHHGFIIATSEQNKGANFTIYLPGEWFKS